MYLYLYTVWSKNIGPPNPMARGFWAPVFWYIILICYQHTTHIIAPSPAPVLIYELGDYALVENKS